MQDSMKYSVLWVYRCPKNFLMSALRSLIVCFDAQCAVFSVQYVHVRTFFCSSSKWSPASSTSSAGGWRRPRRSTSCSSSSWNSSCRRNSNTSRRCVHARLILFLISEDGNVTRRIVTLSSRYFTEVCAVCYEMDETRAHGVGSLCISAYVWTKRCLRRRLGPAGALAARSLLT